VKPTRGSAAGDGHVGGSTASTRACNVVRQGDSTSPERSFSPPRKRAIRSGTLAVVPGAGVDDDLLPRPAPDRRSGIETRRSRRGPRLDLPPSRPRGRERGKPPACSQASTPGPPWAQATSKFSTVSKGSRMACVSPPGWVPTRVAARFDAPLRGSIYPQRPTGICVQPGSRAAQAPVRCRAPPRRRRAEGWSAASATSSSTVDLAVDEYDRHGAAARASGGGDRAVGARQRLRSQSPAVDTFRVSRLPRTATAVRAESLRRRGGVRERTCSSHRRRAPGRIGVTWPSLKYDAQQAQAGTARRLSRSIMTP